MQTTCKRPTAKANKAEEDSKEKRGENARKNYGNSVDDAFTVVSGTGVTIGVAAALLLFLLFLKTLVSSWSRKGCAY